MNYLVLKVCDPGDVVGLVVDDDVCSVSGVPNRLCCYLGSAEALTPVFLVLREFHVRILHYLSYSVRTGSWDRVLVEVAVETGRGAETPILEEPLHVKDQAVEDNKSPWEPNEGRPEIEDNLVRTCHIYGPC